MPALQKDLSKIENYSVFLSSQWKKHLAKRSADALTVISTFAGVGGSSLGYSMAGYNELLAVEWDKRARETFETNFSNIPVFGEDIASLTLSEVYRFTGLQVYRRANWMY